MKEEENRICIHSSILIYINFFTLLLTLFLLFSLLYHSLLLCFLSVHFTISNHSLTLSISLFLHNSLLFLYSLYSLLILPFLIFKPILSFFFFFYSLENAFLVCFCFTSFHLYCILPPPALYSTFTLLSSPSPSIPFLFSSSHFHNSSLLKNIFIAKKSYQEQ